MYAMNSRVNLFERMTIGYPDQPSMSAVRPMVFFHCFPARAIRRSWASPSFFLALQSSVVGEVAFAISIVEAEGPEKYA